MGLYSIIGAGGFVGSHLVTHLTRGGHECQAIYRRDPLPRRLGHAIYCVGVSNKAKPMHLINAHVSTLSRVLQCSSFDSFTYLSSTRVYQYNSPKNAVTEAANLTLNPANPSDLFNISKIAGESLCLSFPQENIRVVRLSNVYGPNDKSNNFLTAILRQVLTLGRATIVNGLNSCKDYIDVQDVMMALENIPIRASSRIINVATGRNVSNRKIISIIKSQTGVIVDVRQDLPEVRFPVIAIDRLIKETGVRPRAFTKGFPALIKCMRAQLL